MRILIAMRQPSLGGGVRGHVETVAQEMQRTGHDVWIFSHDDLPWREEVEARGLRTLGSLEHLEQEFDVAIAHDQPSIYDVVAAKPGLPIAFVWHGNVYDVDMAAQLDGAVQLIFQPYGPLPTRADSTSVKVPQVSVRQPIDVHNRFVPLSQISATPRKALMLSNYTTDVMRELLVEACGRAGIELTLRGFHEVDGPVARPEFAINDVDIVFGKGRVIMEAMACGRAAYVYDFFGSDGFVTDENLETLLSSGIGGSSTEMVASVDRIVAELGNYDRRMGTVNRDLAKHHFSVTRHVAVQIAALEEMLAGEARPAHNDAAFELARMSRVAWRFEGDAHVLSHRLQKVETERDEWRERHEQMLATKRWKLATTLTRPLDRLRGRG